MLVRSAGFSLARNAGINATAKKAEHVINTGSCQIIKSPSVLTSHNIFKIVYLLK